MSQSVKVSISGPWASRICSASPATSGSRGRSTVRSTIERARAWCWSISEAKSASASLWSVVDGSAPVTDGASLPHAAAPSPRATARVDAPRARVKACMVFSWSSGAGSATSHPWVRRTDAGGTASAPDGGELPHVGGPLSTRATRRNGRWQAKADGRRAHRRGRRRMEVSRPSVVPEPVPVASFATSVGAADWGVPPVSWWVSACRRCPARRRGRPRGVRVRQRWRATRTALSSPLLHAISSYESLPPYPSRETAKHTPWRYGRGIS